MQKKNYTGYHSFQYLEPGRDYKVFALAKELERVKSLKVQLNADQTARAKRLFEENVVISLHDHCFIAPENLEQFFEFRRWGRDFTGFWTRCRV
jgi:membrane dipeptidase